MKIVEMIATSLEDLKRQKNLDVNIETDERGWNALFVCTDLDKVSFFIDKGIDVNHIAKDGSSALFRCKTVEKFKMIASKIHPDLLYHLNDKNQHFVSVIDKESLSFLLNETSFDLDMVLKNHAEMQYKSILRSLLGNREDGFYDILKKKLKGKELPFNFFNEKGHEVLYVNNIPNAEIVKLCFEFTPKLYEIFDNKKFKKREEYFELIDNNAFYFIDDFKAIFGEVKAKKEKDILMNLAISEKEILNEKRKRM